MTRKIPIAFLGPRPTAADIEAFLAAIKQATYEATREAIREAEIRRATLPTRRASPAPPIH